MICMQYMILENERYNKSNTSDPNVSVVLTRLTTRTMRFQFVVISTFVVLVIAHHKICVMRDRS